MHSKYGIMFRSCTYLVYFGKTQKRGQRLVVVVVQAVPTAAAAVTVVVLISVSTLDGAVKFKCTRKYLLSAKLKNC